MARAKADPDAQIVALEAKRVDLAKQRHELEDVERVQLRVVEEAPERRRAVLLAQARAESPSESVEQIEADRHRAAAEAAGTRERREALRTVEQEIEQEVEAVEDGHRA